MVARLQHGTATATSRSLFCCSLRPSFFFAWHFAGLASNPLRLFFFLFCPFSRGSSQEFTNKVITLWYRPPELLLGATRYGFAVDIWSAGCILAELVLGRPLFTGKTEMDQLKLIFDMVGTPTTRSWPGITDLKLLRTGDVSIDGDSNRKRPKLRERYLTKMNANAPGAVNLVEKLLECDPSKRLTASRALDHRYFFQEPRAPDQPEELGEMKLAEGGSFHEFQTKKKRKEAKAQAEKIKQAALDGGHTAKQAQEEFDACYRGIMEKVAQEGLALANAAAKNSAGVEQIAEGDTRELQDERGRDVNNDQHREKYRSSRSDRSPDRRTSNSRSSRERDYRDSSSRGKERRPSSSRHESDRERSRDMSEKEKNRDGSKEMDNKERSRSSRRSSESEDRKKKRRREGEKKSKDSTMMDTENSEQAKETAVEKPQSEQNEDGEKKRSDRPRDRSRDDDSRKERRDRDRDRDHRRRSKEREGRSRDSDRDRASSGRSRDDKKRKSRNRSRSTERDGSPGRSRDDRHHRQRREREHPRHERDRDRRHPHDDMRDSMRDSERRPRNDPHYPPDDWGPRGPLPPMQRRRDEFGGGNPDFDGPPRHPHDRHPRGGDPGPYGGDWGPRGGPDFRGPPGRRGGPPHGGRPMDYYPPGGDPGYRDRDRNRDRGPRRDRERR